MANGNRNVCKAFKDMRGNCVGCTGICEGSLTVQHFESTADCKDYVQQHCEQGGAGCPISEALSSLQCRSTVTE